MPEIKADSITFYYSENAPVLKKVSFEVNKKERWAVIGRNGSGKSTLLKCLGNLLKVKGGTVSVAEKPVASYRPVELARLVAYVPQAGNRSLPPFSVNEFVLLGRFPYQGFFAIPGRHDRQIALAALRCTDTESLADRRLDTLSGGELQRVYIAAAVAQQTALLLLDEPMAFLDPLHQALVQRALDQICEEFSTTMIAVTHDVNHALNRFSHICALVEGEPFFIGTAGCFKEKSHNLLRDIFGISFSEINSYDGISKYYLPETIS
ncbi:MAG: ABC transporter ATP-binding protein [Chitinispirillaceae bacterium]|nr:ABC transporter ATP-binding protein [Chitinispirillaceae bacterium]